jgi:hypothetical protein
MEGLGCREQRISMLPAGKPREGEKFVISLQENGEMLSQLDDGRTFRFVSPSGVEHDQQESRILTVVNVDVGSPYDDDPRLVGSLSYTD